MDHWRRGRAVASFDDVPEISARYNGGAQPVTEPPPVVEFADDTAMVGMILQPNGIDIVAEPPRPVLPCLVEAPTTFFVQIEKMVE